MANIRTNVKQGKVYASVSQYAEAWCRMFRNARVYNREGSQIYEDAKALESVFLSALRDATRIHGIVLEEDELEFGWDDDPEVELRYVFILFLFHSTVLISRIVWLYRSILYGNAY